MRDASVGFQCPSCVSEGAKSTRQARAPYGGNRSTNPALTSMALIATNVAVWLAILAGGGPASRLVDQLALRANGLCLLQRGGFEIPQSTCQGTFLPGVADGAWWQLLTNAFTHVEVWHIGFNMLALWFLGPQLELAIGRLRFLALYLISALAGSTLVLWAAPEYQSTLGASGAVFGLMGALLVLAFKVGGNVSQIGTWLLLNAVLTFTIPNISWQGHLGGFLGGLLVAGVLAYSPRERRGTWQLIGLSALTVAILVAIALRISLLTA